MKHRTKGPHLPRRRRMAVVVAGLVVAVVMSGAYVWRSIGGRMTVPYALAAESRLAPRMRQASPDIREAYRFAIANRDTLKQFPCFCGCFIEAGHTSNASCYIRDVRADGSIDFDDMSLS